MFRCSLCFFSALSPSRVVVRVRDNPNVYVVVARAARVDEKKGQGAGNSKKNEHLGASIPGFDTIYM